MEGYSVVCDKEMLKSLKEDISNKNMDIEAELSNISKVLGDNVGSFNGSPTYSFNTMTRFTQLYQKGM